MSDDQFYCYTQQDFVEVPIESVQIGDELSWAMGHSSLYGVCHVQEIADGFDDALKREAERQGIKLGRTITFPVMPGMEIRAMRHMNVSVCWENDTPIITGTVWIELGKMVLVLPRQERKAQ